MVTYILVLYIYAGAFAQGDSVALTTIPGFTSLIECQQAAEQAQSLAVGTKNAKTECIKQTK